MSTHYWMSRYEDGVVPPKRIGGSPYIHDLAMTITDLPRADYVGPIPEPGETITGTVLCSMRHIAAKQLSMKVFVRAEDIPEVTEASS